MRFGRGPGIPFGIQWFFDGEGGSGGGGGEDDTARRNLESLLAKKNGDAVALAAQLLAENNDERDKRRILRGEITDLKKKVPAEGAVLLSADDAKAWADYQALGPIADVKAAVAERDTLKTDKVRLEGEIATGKREGILRDVAGDSGFKFAVLKDRDERTPGLEYVKKTVKVDGQDVEQWHVKYKDGEGDSAPVKEEALVEFATKKWADFLPALKVEQAQDSTGTRHVSQGSGGASGGGSIFDKIRKDAETKEKGSEQGPPLEQRLNMPAARAAS